MTTADHRPLEADTLPTAAASEDVIARDAAAALAYLRRVGALDVAECLGLAS